MINREELQEVVNWFDEEFDPNADYLGLSIKTTERIILLANLASQVLSGELVSAKEKKDMNNYVDFNLDERVKLEAKIKELEGV